MSIVEYHQVSLHWHFFLQSCLILSYLSGPSSLWFLMLQEWSRSHEMGLRSDQSLNHFFKVSNFVVYDFKICPNYVLKFMVICCNIFYSYFIYNFVNWILSLFVLVALPKCLSILLIFWKNQFYSIDSMVCWFWFHYLLCWSSIFLSCYWHLICLVLVAWFGYCLRSFWPLL